MFASLYSLDVYAHLHFLSVLLKQVLVGFFVCFFLENKVLLPAMCIFLCISTDKLCDLNAPV